MGQEGLAPSKKNAARLKAHLVFLDESGLLMTPLLRRTWARVGQTPVLYQRTRHREKVSVIAAVTISPRRQRVGLYFSLFPNMNVNAEVVIWFLRQLRSQLCNPMIIIWDRLKAHRARLTKDFLAQQSTIHTAFLPPYAPELNPVESLWGYLKMNPLANLAADDAEDLACLAEHSVKDLQKNEALLRSLIQNTPLSICLR